MIEQILKGKEVDEVVRIRQIAIDREFNFDTEAGYWFKMATGRINLLKQIEDELALRLKADAAKHSDAATASLAWIGAFTAVALMLTLLLMSAIYSLINRQLNALSTAMEKVENDSDLSARAEVICDDGLGKAAASYNEMMENLSTLVYQVRDASQQLVQQVQQVQQVSSDVDQEVQDGLAQTEMVAAAMNEMGASIREVAQNCAHASDKAGEANGSVQHGQEVSIAAKGRSTSSVPTLIRLPK